MKEPRPGKPETVFDLKAPVSVFVKKARAAFPAFSSFAHHPPADMEGEDNPRMKRPRGGHGPHNG